MKFYTNAQLAGFSFLETFLLKLLNTDKKKPVQYIYMKLAEFLSNVKNRGIRPKANY